MPDSETPTMPSQPNSGGEADPLAESLAESHTENAPEPSEHAIKAEEEDREFQAVKDDHGEPFDPDKHQTNKDGTPRKTKGGRWAKKPGAKSGQSGKGSASPSASSLSTGGRTGGTGQNSSQADSGPSDQEYRMAAEGLVSTIYMLGNMVAGDEWSPVQQTDESGNVIYDEYVYGVDVWERYFKTKEVTDIPPGLAVTIWCAVVFGTRATQGPKTREKMAYGLGRVKGWWQEFKKKRARKKRKVEKDS